LLELLVVIAIMGILAAITLPNMHSFKPNVTASASRQLLDAVGRARQLAIAQRTTVYMVFVPANFWLDPAYAALPQAEKDKASGLYGKQLIGYNYVTVRSLGDQPGQPRARYLDDWRTLPEGTFITPQKFVPFSGAPVLTVVTNLAPWAACAVYGFSYTNNIPFPSEMAPGPAYVWLPHLAFNYLGQLVSGRSELVPLTKGSVSFARDPGTKTPLAVAPTLTESPPGNVTNSYNMVSIDWLTGRARLLYREVR
jgi:type II secretory pathway pseudopilin PulG